MNTREIIQKIKDLNGEMEKFRAQIESQIVDIANRVVVAEKNKYGDHGDYPRQALSTYNWNFGENDEINCGWSEYAGGGEYDNGSFSFPISFLYEPENLKTFENECLEVKRQRQYEEKLRIENQERQQFEALKKKYNS